MPDQTTGKQRAVARNPRGVTRDTEYTGPEDIAEATRPELPPLPRTITTDTELLLEHFKLAIAAETAAITSKTKAREVIEAEAQVSGELEQLKQQKAKAEETCREAIEDRDKAKKATKLTATGLGAALGAVLLVFTTAWGVYRDGRQAAGELAEDAKALAAESKTVAEQNQEMLLQHDVDIAAIKSGIRDLTSAVNALVEASGTDTVSTPPPKKRKKAPP